VHKPLAISLACLTLLAGCGQTSEALGQLHGANSASAEPSPRELGCAGHPTGAYSLPNRYDGTLTLQPSHAHAGDMFTARFPNRKARTDILVMFPAQSRPCARWFVLQADGPEPGWRELQGRGGVMTLGAVRPRSSIPAIVPDVAEPGVYRVCDDESRACDLLEVVR